MQRRPFLHELFCPVSPCYHATLDIETLQPTEQDINRNPEEGSLAYIAKIMLRDLGLFIVLPCAVLIMMYAVIQFPRSLIIIFSLLIFYGLLVIIFAVTIIRHIDQLIFRMKRAIGRIDPEYFGKDQKDWMLGAWSDGPHSNWQHETIRIWYKHLKRTSKNV